MGYPQFAEKRAKRGNEIGTGGAFYDCALGFGASNEVAANSTSERSTAR